MRDLSATETAFTHGLGVWPEDGREVAFCRYHGLIAAAPSVVSNFVRSRWAHHISHECIIPTIEERSSTLTDHEGNLTGYFINIDLWREIRVALRRGDHPPVSSP